jgi:hypothetical protein
LDTPGAKVSGKTPVMTESGEKGNMGTTRVFRPTAIQKKALWLLKSGAKHILHFG